MSVACDLADLAANQGIRAGRVDVRSGGHVMREPDVAAYHRVVAYDGLAAEYGTS